MNNFTGENFAKLAAILFVLSLTWFSTIVRVVLFKNTQAIVRGSTVSKSAMRSKGRIIEYEEFIDDIVVTVGTRFFNTEETIWVSSSRKSASKVLL